MTDIEKVRFERAMLSPPKETIELCNLIGYLFRLMNSLITRFAGATHVFLTSCKKNESVSDIHQKKKFALSMEITSMLYACRLFERYDLVQVTKELAFLTTATLPTATEAYQPDCDFQTLEIRSICRFFYVHHISTFEKQQAQYVRLCDALLLLDDRETVDIVELKGVLSQINIRYILRQILTRLNDEVDAHEVRLDTQLCGRCIMPEHETKILAAFNSCVFLRQKMQNIII